MKRLELWVLTLISGFAVYLFDKLVGPSIDWGKINGKWLIQWLNIDIKIYQIVVFGAVFSLCFLLARKIRSKEGSYYSKKQVELRKFNKTEIGGILWKWNVYFEYTGKPAISDLTPYCVSHGSLPLKMKESYYGFKCLAYQCNRGIAKQTNASDSVEGVEHYIQSELEERWERINRN